MRNARISAAIKNRPYILLLAPAVIFIVAETAVSAVASFDNGISLDTCAPNGAINRAKEQLDPKSFWIAQSVALESAVDRWEIGEKIDACSKIPDPFQQERCVAFSSSRWNAALNCRDKANLLCAAAGGNC